MAEKLQASTPGAAGFNPARIRLIQDRLKSWVDEGRTPAISALVARQGQVVLHEAHGKRTPDSPDNSLKVDDIFPVMSITKPVTATAAMILVEEGLLGMNRPVRDYIPEITGDMTDEILVHHLMTHTSGYVEEDLFPLRAKRIDLPPRDPTQDKWTHVELNQLYDAPLSYKPGTRNSYGIHGITLLGEIVRRISGQSLNDFFTSRILDPLGMKDSGLLPRPGTRERIVERGTDTAFGNADYFINLNESIDLPSAAGGLLSTTWDLAIFAQAFMNGGIYDGARILASHTVSEMMRNQIPGIAAEGWGGRIVPEASWGYGWMVQGQEKWPYWGGSLQPLGTVYHQGIGACFLWMDLKHDVVGVYLTIATEFDMETTALNWDLDLFQNMVTAAVAN